MLSFSDNMTKVNFSVYNDGNSNNSPRMTIGFDNDKGGLRIDFDGRSGKNKIELAQTYNGTTTYVNRVNFPHI